MAGKQERAAAMKRSPIFAAFAALAVVAGAAAAVSPAAAPYDSARIFGGHLPPGYRDWRLISVAHEAGNLNDIRAVLGDGAATKAYRNGRTPFPDGAIIARIAWAYVPSAENDKAFGRAQSFVAGAPTNVQFMVKDCPQIRRHRRLGLRPVQRRQTRAHRRESLLRLPRAREGPGLCVHALCAVRTRRRLIPGSG